MADYSDFAETCATCFFGDFLSGGKTECYCLNGNSHRFADVVNADSSCECWSKTRFDDEGQVVL